MFGSYRDERTPEEKRRDREIADVNRANQKLAVGFLKNMRPLLKERVADVGLVGDSRFGSGAELLIEADGVMYKITAQVERDE